MGHRPTGRAAGSLPRKSCARYEIRATTTSTRCSRPAPTGTDPAPWISRDIKKGYRRLHELGWVHSVEAWSPDGRLAGGLYGVSIGGLFAGELMLARPTLTEAPPPPPRRLLNDSEAAKQIQHDRS